MMCHNNYVLIFHADMQTLPGGFDQISTASSDVPPFPGPNQVRATFSLQ